ncbi:winged helix-turn-helix transcriptional regulator [Psychrobacillus sp. FSL K6-2843]|uniref:LexA family protein n=1 Tax=Psychrobacillus sp. FSL K6-2843 TaxID=2921549 RepID=UPI00315ACAA3
MKKRQQDIYKFIEEYISEQHYSPTVREIAKAVGLSSTATVHGHLKRMRRKGYIDFIDSRPRTIQII